VNEPFQAPVRQAQRGLSLIESLISVAVLAVSVGSVAPGFGQVLERRHLDGVSAQLGTDLRLARSLAVSHRAPVRLSVHNTAGLSCYVVHTGSASECSCTGADTAVCTGSAQALRTVSFDPSHPVRISASSASMLFDPDRGTVTPTGTLRLHARNGTAIHQVVNIMGRVRTCSPGAAVPGHPKC